MSYQGDARPVLAIALLLIALVVALSGTRLRSPQPIRRPRRAGTGVLVAVWIAALIAFVVGFSRYASQESRDYPDMARPPTPILPVTLTAAVVTAALIVAGTRGPSRDRIANGVIGALIAPMIFELPFDLIVMARTYPPVSPHPALYRAVFFGPLLLVEVTTIALVVLAPAATLSRAAVYTFAVMLAVFAGWSLVGLGFPATPATTAFNVTSKLLAFIAVAGLFFPHWIQHAAGKVLRRESGPK